MSVNTNLGFFQSVGLLFLRVFTGAGMAYHGFGKVFGGGIEGLTGAVQSMGFPMPEVFAWAASLSELAGGLFIALGLFTPQAAFFVFCTMSVAAFITHGSDPFSKKELALAYWSISGALMLIGVGRSSRDDYIDSVRKKR